MTLREIIYDILENLNVYSDDTKFSEEHIAFMVNNKRNLLLRQYMSNLKKVVPKEAIQVICVPLEIDENCFENIEVLKSINKLPSTLDNTGRSNIIDAYVGSRFIKNINIIEYDRLPYLQGDKYNKLQTYVMIDPHFHLVVYNSAGNHLMLESIEVTGVFENPEEAYNMNCNPDEDVCDFLDATYPIESSLIDPLKNQIVRELLLKHQIDKDEINDGEDTVTASNRRRAPRNEEN